MKKKGLWFIFLMILIIASNTNAQEFVLSNLKVEPESCLPGEKILVSCTVTHRAGASAIQRVAALISTEKVNSSYPDLYDDGTNGDLTANDGVYSLEITAPEFTGQVQIVFIALDVDMHEIESEPLIFTIK